MSQAYGEKVSRDSSGSLFSSQGARIAALEANPVLATYAIKVCADDDAVATGDGLFIFCVEQDLNGKRLISAEAYVTTVGSSATVVQIRKVGASDMLSTRITIDSGEKNSYDSATRSVVAANDDVFVGDHLSVDVDSAGSGAMGLGIMLAIG